MTGSKPPVVNSGWHNVANKKPKYYEPVLAYVGDVNIRGMIIAWYKPDHTWFSNEYAPQVIQNIMYWMELPDPPKYTV